MGIVLVSRYYATLRSTGLGGTLDTQRYVHTNIARDRNFFPWSPCSLFWVFLKSRPTHFLMWFLKEYAPCLTKDTRIKSNDISSIMLSMNATMLFKKGRQMCWIMHSNKCTISTDKTVDCCHFCFFVHPWVAISCCHITAVTSTTIFEISRTASWLSLLMFKKFSLLPLLCRMPKLIHCYLVGLAKPTTTLYGNK